MASKKQDFSGTHGIFKYLRRNLDVKLTGYLATFYFIIYLVGISKTLYIRFFVYQRKEDFSLPQLFTFWFLDWLFVVAFMTVIAVITKRMKERGMRWKKLLFLNLIFALLMAVFAQLLFDFAKSFVSAGSLSRFDPHRSLVNFIALLDVNLLVYCSLVFTIYIYYYIKEIKKKEAEKLKLQSQLSDARIRMLTGQLQPHFLFNSINAVVGLIDIDKRKAQDCLVDLSDFFRDVLSNSQQNLTTVEKELIILEKYLSVMQVRYGGHLLVKKEISREVLGLQMPVMLLQPLVENAIKHGYSGNTKCLRVLIKIAKAGKYLIIDLENDGHPIANVNQVFTSGVGLSNLFSRLSKLYGKDFKLNITNLEKESGVGIHIEIPVKFLKKNKSAQI
ncbi:histidine kinase [Zunongwangia sp. F363]|uniref:Histidine kinase n=1 Tax=Autumnicola tepida TaxID=3075595 RepID=A0ABU3CBQ9_9FLAO|nr:histidine kinase [Zunongwangia sp. F363]MDT0643766.1 histidine kinase [Zunongwangia sp. F363]